MKVFGNGVKIVRNVHNRVWFFNNDSEDTILDKFNILVQKDGDLEELFNALCYITNGQLSVQLCGYEVTKKQKNI